MTGQLAESLDLTPSPDAIERHAEPILAVCEIDAETKARFSVAKAKESACNCTGFTISDLCQSYLTEPSPQTRELILRSSIRTGSDALSVLALLEVSDDAEIANHLLRMLRVHLSAA
jgi:hypothetical protein